MFIDSSPAITDGSGRLLVGAIDQSPSVIEPLLAGARSGFGLAHLPILLSRLRIPKRSPVIETAGEIIINVKPICLCLDLFGAPPPDYDFRTWDSVDTLGYVCNRINDDLFPINFDELNDAYNSGEEDMMDTWIAYEKFGVPWEVVGVTDIDDAVLPLVAIYAINCPPGPYGIPGMEEEPFLDWWDTLPGARIRNYSRGPRFDWPCSSDGVDAMTRRLQQLQPPLNGLAALLLCIVKNTGNPFIDMTEHFLDYEDGDWFYTWNVGDIRCLAQRWSEVRDGIEQMQAYLKRYSRMTDTDTCEIMSLLLRLSHQVDKSLHQPQPQQTLVKILGGSQ